MISSCSVPHSRVPWEEFQDFMCDVFQSDARTGEKGEPPRRADPECEMCPIPGRTAAFICPACGASRGDMMKGIAYGDKLKSAGAVIAPALA